MTGSRLMHWILCGLVAAAGVAGCTGDTSSTASGPSGSLNLNLELAPGVVINEVDWVLSGNGMAPMDGTIDTSAPGATASVEVFGLAPGENYLVELSATSEDGLITCGGSANFDVQVGIATDVMVMLNCKRPARYGGVRVNGKFNICAELAKVVVSPLQTSVGNQIDLSAAGKDEEGDSISYIWTGTGGTIADPNATSTTFTCGEVGDQMITITVSDDDFEFCMAQWSVPVTCVAGEGDLCADVTCEGDGNQCTTTACNPANGLCETSNAEDGTECDGGTCSGGECVAVDLCEGVDCTDENDCTADACDPADGSCSSTPLDDGTACGSNGMCVDGSCVEADLCDGVVCDDTGNECTMAMCNMQTGNCETMNVPDGASCDGGAGACSGGECITNNLCDGVDCTSSNQCIDDGVCDPADGSCIGGNNKPAGMTCDQDGGSVCNGSGACVQCNDAGQCPSDGNDCTAATCTEALCGQSNVADGTACDGGAGACSGGVCMANDLCAGVECPSSSECVNDGMCDPADGNCTTGSNKAADTACTEGGGNVCDGAGNCVACNNDNQCTGGDVCTNHECVAGTVDPDPVTQIITMGCTNNVTANISILPFELSVDPGPILSNSPFAADLTGVAVFSESFLDAGLATVPGLKQATLVDAAATVQVRSGATGSNVVLNAEPIPLTCSGGMNAGGACTTAADCPPGAPYVSCAQIVQIPTIDGTGDACAACIAADPCTDGSNCKAAQCAANGYCIAPGNLPLQLESTTGNWTAAASGSVLFGWDDTNTGATVAGNGTWVLPAASFGAPTTPNGVRVIAAVLQVALQCTMGVDADGPDGVGVPDQASPTPDSALIAFDIQ